MKIILYSCACLLMLSATSQEVYIEAGRVISNFEYSDSQGESADFQAVTNNAIGFGFKGPFDFTQDRMALVGGISFSGYGATAADTVLRNDYSWDVNYLGINVGLEFDVLDFKGFQFYVKGLISPEILLQGTQTINGERFNLKGKEQFDGAKVFLRAGAGISYDLVKDVNVFAFYLMGKNMFNIGEKEDTTESLAIITHTVNVGLSIQLQNFERFR